MPLILDGDAVARLLKPHVALEAMRELFSMDLSPDAAGYGRIDLPHPNGWLRLLPGYLPDAGVFGFKSLNRANGVGMRYGIYVHDLETGGLRGIVDGRGVTNLRTGAVTALGTDLLAPPDVEEAAIIGTGQVAGGQCLALQLVRPVRRLRVYARSSKRRATFISAMRNHITAELVEATSLSSAIDGVGMVTLATNAAEPVIDGDHIKAGMHINSVGPASRDRVELDPACFTDFDHIICDSVDLVFNEAGDAYRATQIGFDPNTALDLADAMANPPSRRKRDRTLFKSVGTGLQDLIVAVHLLDAASTWGIGHEIDDYLSVKPFGSPSS